MISTKRISLLLVAFITLVAVVFVRTTSLYVVRASSSSVTGTWQPGQLPVAQKEYQPMRGIITDRNGAPLVTTQIAYNIRAEVRAVAKPTDQNPYGARLTVTDTGRIANIIAPAMGVSAPELKTRLDGMVADYANDRVTNALLFANATLSQTYAITSALAAQKVGGVELEESAMRVYPQDDLAGPLLGFVSIKPLGYTGVEGFYEQKLAGSAGEIKRRGLLDLITVTEEIDGATIQLTLDSVLQNYVENRLTQAISATQASGGSVIVMDSRTGAIYAWASNPGYDPAQAMKIAADKGLAYLRDPNVSDAYEPGSVMKLVTVASALDAGKITRNQAFYDPGKFDVGGTFIYNSGYKKYGDVTLVDVFQESINVVAAQIAKDMTAPVFYDYIGRFGFGRGCFWRSCSFFLRLFFRFGSGWFGNGCHGFGARLRKILGLYRLRGGTAFGHNPAQLYFPFKNSVVVFHFQVVGSIGFQHDGAAEVAIVVRPPGIDDFETADPHPDAVVHFGGEHVFARFGRLQAACPADRIIRRVQAGSRTDPVPREVDFTVHPAHHFPVKIGTVEIFAEQPGLGI
jgi:cell division protein FtsI/penicillin-binding protein 2